MIPIATLLGIALIRMTFGLVHNFDDNLSFSSLFILTSSIVTFQLAIGLLGYKIMKVLNYFEEFVHSSKKSPGALALVCPGVAFFVFGMFFIHFGLVKNGIIDIFSVLYYIILLPFIFVQIKTIQIFFKLYKKFFIKVS